jgi:hypothetical protein
MMKKKKFIVETISTFSEIHIVEAENEQQAQFIAKNSDYNASKWLGQQFVAVEKYSEQDLKRIKARDDYFFEGYSTIDKDGCLVYKKMNGQVYGNMPKEKLI